MKKERRRLNDKLSLCYDFQKWTMITLASVAISLTVGLITIAYGQPVQFKTYINNDLKFSIQYPSNWQVEEKKEYPNSVTFQIPDRAYNSSFFMVSVGEPEPNNTLEQEVKKGIDTDISILKSKVLKQIKSLSEEILESRLN